MAQELPHPFLKWAGGKRSLLSEILPRLPEQIGRYVEPFMGGAAVFFALVREGRLESALLTDRNPQLVQLYEVVKSDPESLILALGEWEHSEKSYYHVRSLDPAELDPAPRAARLLWLNRTCYNGLYRLNRAGRFNVPFGRYNRPRIIHRENLMACSEALQKAEIRQADFSEVMKELKAGDVIYCDPPYWPLKESSFTHYDGQPFTEKEQRQLEGFFRGLEARGVRGLLSNSSTPETRALYEGLKINKVQVRRNINRLKSGRGPVEELLVESQALP